MRTTEQVGPPQRCGAEWEMEVEIEMGETDKSGDGGKSDSEGSRSVREEVVSERE